MRMPDGRWGNRDDIELVAQPWRCGNPGIMTCTVHGNSLTLAHGGASFTLTMALAERQTVVATNVRQTITLGSIRTSMVGAFVVPPPVSPWHEMFSFTMFLRSSEPLATSTARGLVSWNGTRVDSLYSGVERTGFGLQTLPHPTGLNYGTVYFPFEVPTIAFADGGEYQMTVGFGIAPEPSTWLLLATGGSALLLLHARRLRSRRAEADADVVI